MAALVRLRKARLRRRSLNGDGVAAAEDGRRQVAQRVGDRVSIRRARLIWLSA